MSPEGTVRARAESGLICQFCGLSPVAIDTKKEDLWTLRTALIWPPFSALLFALLSRFEFFSIGRA